MGNYADLEYDFIDRTLRLISQYEQWLNRVEFSEQYNYTLLINCLLGVIVMPKERIISRIPNDRITEQLKIDMGIPGTVINPDIISLRDFIKALRHSVAHFNIEVVSRDNLGLIDEIIFRDSEKGPDYIVVTFQAQELLPFVRYYADWIKSNLKK